MDAEPRGRTQVVHEGYPQVVDSVDGRVTSVMMGKAAADVPSRPWKARLFWGSVCGRDAGTPCCDEGGGVRNDDPQPVDNDPWSFSTNAAPRLIGHGMRGGSCAGEHRRF
ncbi:hypothetical protein GCM10010177_21400 [Actinomadura citrea]|nr:hypothetical protein GCM10010177_21400 [Actinomadura citrea]